MIQAVTSELAAGCETLSGGRAYFAQVIALPVRRVSVVVSNVHGLVLDLNRFQV